MTEEQIQAGNPPDSAANEVLSQKFEAVGWALFFIWVGISVLADIGWGWGLLGVAAIILGEAVVRQLWDLKIGGFWIVVGLIFLAGGLWELFQVQWPLAPILLIGVGLAVLWGVVSGKHMMKK
jgi:hypothetical protein